MPQYRLSKNLTQEEFNDIFPQGLTDKVIAQMRKNGFTSVAGKPLAELRGRPSRNPGNQDIPDAASVAPPGNNFTRLYNDYLDSNVGSGRAPVDSYQWQGGPIPGPIVDQFDWVGGPQPTVLPPRAISDFYNRKPPSSPIDTAEANARPINDEVVIPAVSTRPRTQAETDAMIEAARIKGSNTNTPWFGDNGHLQSAWNDIKNIPLVDQVIKGNTGNPVINSASDIGKYYSNKIEDTLDPYYSKTKKKNRVVQEFTDAGIPLPNNVPAASVTLAPSVSNGAPVADQAIEADTGIPNAPSIRPATPAPAALTDGGAYSYLQQFNALKVAPKVYAPINAGNNMVGANAAPPPQSLWDRFRTAAATNQQRQYSNPFDESADPNNFSSARR